MNFKTDQFYKMTSNQNSGLSKEDVKEYFRTYLNENHESDYPDGPFELLDFAKVQHQIDVWK